MNPSPNPISSEYWDEYVLELIEESKKLADSSKFSITFLVDENGIVDSKVFLPNECSQGLKKWSSKLLNAISNGEVKSLIMQGINNLIKTDTILRKEVVSDIVELWAAEDARNSPCIKPTDVLKK